MTLIDPFPSSLTGEPPTWTEGTDRETLLYPG